MSGLCNAPFGADFSTPQSGSARLSDGDLMSRARHGDRAAYGQIVHLHQNRLYNALLRLVGDADEAAELAQEAFGRGLSGISDYTGSQTPYAWIFRTALNLAVASLRKTRRRRAFFVGADESHRVVLEAMGRLDADYRAVLVMRDIERFDFQEIADVLGLELARAKSRLFRARLALRDELMKV